MVEIKKKIVVQLLSWALDLMPRSDFKREFAVFLLNNVKYIE